MKNIFLWILGLLVSFNLQAQYQSNRFVTGKVIHTQVGASSGKFNVSCNFTDEGGLYDGTNVTVGDLLFVSDGGYGFYLPIDSIISSGVSTVIIRVVNTSLSLGTVPTGVGYITKGSTNFQFQPFVSGISDANQQISNEDFVSRLDSILQYRLPERADSIPDYTPGANDSRIAQDNDTGIVYYYDGSNWKRIGQDTLDGIYGRSDTIPDALRQVSMDSVLEFIGLDTSGYFLATVGGEFAGGRILIKNNQSKLYFYDALSGTSYLSVNRQGIVLQANTNGTDDIKIQGLTRFNSILTPVTLSATANNYNPTGFANCNILRLTSTVDVNITGFSNGRNGRLIVVENVGAKTITFVKQNGGSTAANRFATDNVALSAGGVGIAVYDSIASRWRVTGSGGTGTTIDSFYVYNDSLWLRTSTDTFVVDLGLIVVGDDWGSQVTNRDSSLSGNGVTPLGIKGYGAASNGQVPSKATGGITWITPLTAEVDGSTTNEIQQIDTFIIVNDVLRNSLSSDAVPFKSVSLSAYRQTIDTFFLSGTTIYNSLSGDNQPAKTINLAGIIYNNGVDSTWRKIDGSYLGKRITDAINRTGPTGIRSGTDTIGVLNIWENPAQPLKPLIRLKGVTNTLGDSADVFMTLQCSSDHTPFIIGATNTAVISAAGTNVAYYLTRNLLPGGGRFDTTETGGGWISESDFINSHPRFGNMVDDEYHIVFVGDSLGNVPNTGNAQARLLSFAASHNMRGVLTDLYADAFYIERIGGTLNTYQPLKGDTWFSADFYGKTWNYEDTIVQYYRKPQVGIPFMRFRSADDSRYWEMFRPDATDRLVYNPEGNNLSVYGNIEFPTKKTITTDDGSEVQIGSSTKPSFPSIYAPATQVFKIQSVTGGSNVWNTFVNSNNFEWRRPDGNAYATFYTNAPQLIAANDKWGFGKSPGARLDLKQLTDAAGSGMAIANSTGTSYYWSLNASGDMLWWHTGSSQRMMLTQAGNLLLGTSGSPSNKLHVVGTAKITDMTTPTSPTKIVGANAAGELSEAILDTGFSFATSDTLRYVPSIDTFSLSGTTLRISLRGDRVPLKTVDLSSLSGGGAADGNGIYGDGTDNSGDDNLPTGGTQVGMNAIGKTLRLVSNTGNTTTREILRLSTVENAFTRFIVATGPVDSARFFRASVGREYTWQTYGGSAFTIASDSIVKLVGDSLLVTEDIVPISVKTRFIVGLTDQYYAKRFDGNSANNGDVIVSNGTDWIVAPITNYVTGTNYLLNGGNTNGATVIGGTNDANDFSIETNNVVRSTVTGGASTGGAWTATDVTANTNTVETMYTHIVNSSGTAATGLGVGTLYQLETTTTDAQNAAEMDVVASDATHATRTFDFVFKTVASANALAEAFRIGGSTYALTATASVSNTNTAADRLIIKTNSSGTAAANFGGSILFQGESSTTDNQNMGSISAIWETATHASYRSGFVFNLVSNGSSTLTNAASIKMVGTNNPELSLGVASPVLIRAASITTAQAFTIGGSSSALTLSSTSTSSGAITLSNNTQTVGATISIGGGVTYTMTSGAKQMGVLQASFSPTSGTATFASLVNILTVNQTGGANGRVVGFYDNPTLTAVADYRSFESNVNNSAAKGFYQTGSSTTNNFVGATGFGATTAPTDKVEITGNLALLTAGNKIKIATGSNASIGTATLSAGTVTVNTTTVTANSIIFVSYNTQSAIGAVSAPTASITAGTSFVINSSNPLDTSTVNYWIIN